MRNAFLPIAGQKKAGLMQLCFLIIHFILMHPIERTRHAAVYFLAAICPA